MSASHLSASRKFNLHHNMSSKSQQTIEEMGKMDVQAPNAFEADNHTGSVDEDSHLTSG